MLLGIVPVLVLFRYTDAVEGWTQADVIVMLGVQQAMMGMIGMFIIRNMWEMTENVAQRQPRPDADPAGQCPVLRGHALDPAGPGVQHR